MNDNSVWPVVTAVMVVLAVAVCLAMAGDIRFAVIVGGEAAQHLEDSDIEDLKARVPQHHRYRRDNSRRIAMRHR